MYSKRCEALWTLFCHMFIATESRKLTRKKSALAEKHIFLGPPKVSTSFTCKNGYIYFIFVNGGWKKNTISVPSSRFPISSRWGAYHWSVASSMPLTFDKKVWSNLKILFGFWMMSETSVSAESSSPVQQDGICFRVFFGCHDFSFRGEVRWNATKLWMPTKLERAVWWILRKVEIPKLNPWSAF